jgi:hypothetical protein
MSPLILGSNPFRFFDRVTGHRGGLLRVRDLGLRYETAVEIGPDEEPVVYGLSLSQLTHEQRELVIRRLSNDRWSWFILRLSQVAIAAQTASNAHLRDWKETERLIPDDWISPERLREANSSYWRGQQCLWVADVCAALLTRFPRTTPEWAVAESESGLEMPGIEEVRAVVGPCPAPPKLELGEKRPVVPEIVQGAHLEPCGPKWFRLSVAGRLDDVIVIDGRGRCVSPPDEVQVRWMRQIGFATC